MNPDRMKVRKVAFTNRQAATLRDYEVRFEKRVNRAPHDFTWGAGNICPVPGKIVEGALYEVEESGLVTLDKFEGRPVHYDRHIVTVECGGEKVDAVTYIAQPDHVESGLCPTREYLGHLLAGRDLFSENYFARLAATPTVD